MSLLLDLLEEARDLGFLGPGPVSDHERHAWGFAVAAGRLVDHPFRAVDLGSGGGVPGLVLASRLPRSTWVLLDSNRRRVAFLRQAVERLGVEARVTVWDGRAEAAGQTSAMRGTFDLVTARGFGSPAATAECGAPLLTLSGGLVVSEPPDGAGARWPRSGLAILGLSPAGIVDAGARFAVLRQTGPCPSRFPRRIGVPNKRPLF